MLSRILSPASLGDAFDRSDQSRMMVFAGLSFLGFVCFMAVADLSPKDSIVSATTRLAGVACTISTIISLQWAFPEEFRHYKRWMAIFGITGVAVQMVAVNFLMHSTAEVAQFFGFHLLAELFYIGVLILFGICIIKHPLLPNWLAGGMLFAGIVWPLNYLLIAQGINFRPLTFLCWGPALFCEIACCVYFIKAGITMNVQSRQEIERPSR